MADIDELIGQLAFGQTAPKLSSCLGLYLSPETVYISETHFAKDKLVVDHLIRIPVPPPDAAKGDDKTPGPGTASTLNTDFLMDNAKLGALIRQSMSQVRWNSKTVMVTLSHHLGLLRYFTMPAIERRFWKSSVPLEAKKYIPIPFDSLSHDYQVIPLPPDAAGKARQGALIAVTQEKNLANIKTLLEGLGLTVAGMELAPCSVLRMWHSVEKAAQDTPYAQVHFDGGNVRILVSDKGLPVFFREVFLGADAAVADQRKIDLGGCITFAQRQLGVGKLPQIRISGSSNVLAAWQEAFTQETGIPSVVQDTAGLLGIKGGDWGGYAAIGSSLRHLAPTAMTLDLGAIGRITDEEKHVARDILIISLVLAVVIGVYGITQNMLLKYRSRDLANYKREPEMEMMVAGKASAEVDNMLKLMGEQAAMVGDMGQATSKLTSFLTDIVASLPEKVWINSMLFGNPIHRTERIGATMSLGGHAVAPTTGQEQELAFRFKDALMNTPVLGKNFTDLQPAVNAKTATEDEKTSAAAAAALDPGAFTEKQEQRTSFTITGTAKR
ncbi:MAG: hypothetical protein AAB320_08700 [Elusimicrobiota bacterium]